MPKHITLVGMMGAGKSSVAPIVARQLNRPVIEVDQLIEQQENMPISEIFAAKGEAYFRQVERNLISRLIPTPPAVLSLGGGAFQWEATRELLLAETVVFYLSAHLDILCSRLQSSTATRPLLSTPGIDFPEMMRQLLEKRGAYYGLAHFRIETDSHAPEDVAAAIVAQREDYA
jgi:shikimate kinase